MESRQYNIGNMDCAGCAREVESAVGRLDGVEFARVDFLSNSLQLIGDVEFDRLRTQVEALGKTITAGDASAERLPSPAKRSGLLGFWDYLLSRSSSRLAVLGGPEHCATR